jgi:adenylylsulfate kinase
VTIQKATNIHWHPGNISQQERWKKLRCHGGTLWFTGLSGSGKSTIASALEKSLIEARVPTYRLDGDNVRHGLNQDLDFTAEGRRENIRRIGEVTRLFADSGMLSLCSFISPYRQQRDTIRELHAAADLTFLEVFVDTPLDVCEERDPKGLYQKARAGKINQFTGIDSPYEPPNSPDLVLETATMDINLCTRACMDLLRKRGLIVA